MAAQLRALQIPFDEVDVDSDARLRVKYGRDVPVLVRDDVVVAGGTVNISSAGVDSRVRKQPDDSFNREAYALERNFDKLGAKGWELVAVSGPQNDPVFYFKRLKESR